MNGETIGNAEPLHRRQTAGDPVGQGLENGAAEAADHAVFLDRDDQPGLLGGLHDGIGVERLALRRQKLLRIKVDERPELTATIMRPCPTPN